VSSYLQANQDTLGINTARVTHVWTQDKLVSESIAACSQIANVVTDMHDMIGQVDAVILSRDDAENHVGMAKPFIDAGIPIFIDKPLAITREDLAYFSREVAKGKFIMSCSSMRFANECHIGKTRLSSAGKLQLATAVGKKDWLKYGVHLLEALFYLLDDIRPVSVQHIGKEGKAIVCLEFENGFFATLHLFMDITSTFQLSLFGTEGWELIEIRDSYSMFRTNIIEFIRSIQQGKPSIPFTATENIILTLIAGKESMEKGGKLIRLKTES
jgi:hypothetical protein